MNEQTIANINLLTNEARSEIEIADRVGDPNLFNATSLKYGPIAHRVYMTLDVPQRGCSMYHSPSTRRVLLDPWTVFNRAGSAEVRNAGLTVDDPEFWSHPDMIKTLTDYLLQVYMKEVRHAGT